MRFLLLLAFTLLAACGAAPDTDSAESAPLTLPEIY